nr:ABC transporter permease [uncultured Niameybacter sp.]
MKKREVSKKGNILSFVPDKAWVFISFLLAMILWQLISMTEAGGTVFASPLEVMEKLFMKVGDGTLWPHIGYSLFRVICGFSLGFICAIPIAFLMGWYKPVRNLIEPWIQFIRNIPPLAYIPLIIVGAGVGEPSKVIVIFIASFLVLVVTILQGVCNVDSTLIKAAKILGASDRDIFLKVVIPASTPFILVGTRLGLSAALTTLVAAELTGASKGLGMMIQTASGYYDMATVLLGILIIGIIGISMEKLVKYLERRLTGWQETHVQ